MLSSCSLSFLQVTVEIIQNGRNLKVALLVGDLNLFVCSIGGPDALCVINTRDVIDIRPEYRTAQVPNYKLHLYATVYYPSQCLELKLETKTVEHHMS